jgi:YidC/Oxa1 family membrane protein insertase
MDRNTIIGLTLIGVILVTFTIFNQPSAEDLKKEKAKTEAAAKSKKDKEQKAADKQSKDADTTAAPASSGDTTKTTAPAEKPSFKPETLTLESDKISVDFSTKGGIVEAVRLKEFETYHNFRKNDGKITPLHLFDKGDQVNELVFSYGGQEYSTLGKEFTVKSASKTKLVLEHQIGEGSIVYTYNLKKGYDLSYTVKFNKLGDKVQAKNVLMNWNMSMRKTERLLSEQRKVSTVCYQLQDGTFDYLREMGNDEESALEQNVDWLAYKQSYFSAILHPSVPFGKKVEAMQRGAGTAIASAGPTSTKPPHLVGH